MDKNMIHIDDLVKQRLKGGEEQERPGAWLHMKELLDEKIPTQVPVAFNWRRMMSYMAAVLALSAIGIGGYEAISAMRNNENKNIATTNKPSQNNSIDKPVYNSNATNSGKGNIITANDKDKYTTNNIGAENNTTNKNKAAVKKNAVKTTAVKEATLSTMPAKAVTNTTASVQENDKKKTNNNTSKKLINNNLDDNNSSVSANKATANTNKVNTITPAAGNTAKLTATAVANKPGKNKIVPASGNTAANNVAANTEPAINKAKDSIASISVNEKTIIDKRTGKAKFTEEVTSVGKAPMPAIAQRPANSIATAENNYNNPRYVASAASGQVNEVAANTEILPAAKVQAKAATENNSVGLASAHKARKSSGWNFDAVNQFFKDVKYNLGQVTYSTGITGGFNALFLNGGVLPGIQAGVTETFGISEHISIMAGLKYVQNFNSKTVVRDNYVRYQQDDNQFMRDSMDHYYKFSTLQSLSLPITVQYSIGNLNIFGGVSLSYIMSVNTENFDNPIYAYRSTVSSKPATGEKDSMQVNLDDFRARLGVGYVFGVSYLVAPRLSVDARITQNVWDNAKTPGEKVVSDRLYKKPGVQLSVGYNLSGNKKR